MIYEEKKTFNKFFVITAVILLALIFFPVLLEVQELFSDEGLYLAAAREMDQMPALMKTQGDVGYGGYPFYPYLIRLLTDAGVPMIIALRLIPCICLFLIGGIIFLTSWNAKGLTAGIVGLSAWMINFLTIEKFSDGNPVLLGTLCVFSAWMVWYTLGIWRNKWKLAWILTFFICGLTFYTIGFKGLLLIVFPMLFHRRPLTVWTKPRGNAFIAGFLILVLFFLLWGIPRWTAPEPPAWERTAVFLPGIGKYFTQLLTFPFDSAIRFLPWTLFVWAPFCPALLPLDDRPLLSRYLRTVFLGSFIILWLSPTTQSRDLFFILPPLSVLVGMNYWIVVRRYGWKLLKLFEILSLILLIACVAALSYLIIPRDCLPVLITDHLQDLSGSPCRNIGIICSIAGIIFAITAFFMCISGVRVWLTIIVLSGALILPYRGVIIPYQNVNRNKELTGKTFRKAIPEKELPEVVYRMYDIPRLYNEMHYFNIKLKTIGSPEELPKEKSVVYVFSGVVPSAPDRIWDRLYYTPHRNKYIELWRGKLKTEDDYE